MRIWRIIFLRLLACGTIAGSTLPAMAQSAQGVSTYARPKAVPSLASSNFDAAQRCMDDMLARSNYGSGVPIYVPPLDKEMQIGASTREMMVAALARMSERSRLFEIRINPTVEDLAKADRHALVIGGAITAIDKGVVSEGKGGGISIPWISLGYRTQSLDSLLDTTIYFQNINGVVIPLTIQSVSMALRTKSKGGDLSGNVGSVGGFLAVDFARADGQMQAVRALIDLAMIQAVGSWAGVPYQRCLTIRQSDPTAIQTARRVFEKMKPAEQIRKIAEALAVRRLLVGDRPTDSVTQSLRQAIADFQMQQQLPALGLPTFEVYYALYADRYGSAPAPRNPIVAMGRNSNSLGLRIFPFGPNFVSDPDGTPFIVTGQRANFSVSAAQSVHVTCFYTDAGRRTTRIFPNHQHPDDLLLAYESLSLPGPSDIYTIEPDRVGGEEFVTCAASISPITDAQLGTLGRRFEPGAPPLPVADANALVQRLRELGPDQLTVDRLRFVGACQSPRDGKLFLKC